MDTQLTTRSTSEFTSSVLKAEVKLHFLCAMLMRPKKAETSAHGCLILARVVRMLRVLTTPLRWFYVCPPYLQPFSSLFINSTIQQPLMKSDGQCEWISSMSTVDGGETAITNISPSQNSTHPNRKISFLGSNTTCLNLLCNQKHHKRKKEQRYLFHFHPDNHCVIKFI